MKPKWHKKLTKADLKHIVETTESSLLREFRSNRKFQKKYNIRCYSCECIERILDEVREDDVNKGNLQTRTHGNHLAKGELTLCK